MKLDIGIEIRKEILQYSLLLENFTSIFLSTLLGIKNYESTKTFGNQGGSLSFNQKVDLLIDIGALDKEEKKKFICFMEIRNQFAHNFNAKNYESCFSYLKGNANFIIKVFPQDAALPMEEQLQKAVTELADDVVKKTVNLIEKVKEKFGKDIETEMLKKFQKDSLQSIEEIENAFNDLYTTKKKNGEKTIDIDELMDLGSLIRKAYFGLVMKKIKEKISNH